MIRMIFGKKLQEPECLHLQWFTGVKKGWLDSKIYGEPARKSWLALVSKLDEKANFKDVCEGTNKGFSVQYYQRSPAKNGRFTWSSGNHVDGDGIVGEVKLAAD